MSEQLKEEFPYNEVFRSDFTLTFNSTIKALENLGWKVEEASTSSLTKKDRLPESDPLLRAYIFTKIKQRQFFIASTYSTINARVETVDDYSTAVSIRYLAITPIPPFFKQKVTHKNDRLVKKLYAEIEEILGITH